MNTSAFRIGRRLAAVAAVAAVGFLLLLAGCQNSMIYFPEKASDSVVRREAAANGFSPWNSPAGELIGWRGGARSATNRVLVFHGNAGMALNRAYFRDGFVGLGAEWEVFIMEYPGYGARPGSPGEKSFGEAAREAFNALQAEGGASVYVLGESIGSGVAAGLAAAFPEKVAGLVLVTPFTSLLDTAGHHYPWIPVGLILRDRYDNVAALKMYAGPLAVILAGKDEIVPTALGQRLHDSYAGPKRLWIQPEAGHNSLNYDPRQNWWRELAQFLSGTR